MGHRVARAASHLSAASVKEDMNTDRRPWVRQHWWIIYHALIAPREAEEIALHTGASVTTVHRVFATYNLLPARSRGNTRQGRPTSSISHATRRGAVPRSVLRTGVSGTGKLYLETRPGSSIFLKERMCILSCIQPCILSSVYRMRNLYIQES